MGKTSKAEYQAAIAKAGDQWDGLNADNMSEAEQTADALVKNAPKPRKRVDGLPVASEHKRSNALTENQRLFTIGVIRGQSLRSTYREAFKNYTGSDASISASANKLMKDPRVQQALKEAWGETIEHLSEDVAASKRYVLKGLLALSKDAQSEQSRIRALELMGKACGLFAPSEVIDKAVVSAEQLKRELSGHMKLMEQGKANVLDVEAKSMTRLNSAPEPDAEVHEVRVNVG